MSEAVVVAIIVGVPVVVTGFLTYRQGTKVAKLSTDVDLRKIEAEAYQRAKGLYEAGIEQLKDQVKNLREQLVDEKNISQSLRDQVNEMERTIEDLQRQLNHLKVTKVDV